MYETFPWNSSPRNVNAEAGSPTRVSVAGGNTP